MNETDNPKCTVVISRVEVPRIHFINAEVNARARHFFADIQMIRPA